MNTYATTPLRLDIERNRVAPEVTVAWEFALEEKAPAFTDANWIKPTLISDLSRAFYVSSYKKKQIVTASNEQSATQRFWHNTRHEVYYRLQKSLGTVTQKNLLMPLPHVVITLQR